MISSSGNGSPSGRSRRAKATDARKEVFLEAYRKSGSTTQASKAAGCSYYVPYLWAKEDSVFRAEFACIRDATLDSLEDIAYGLAREGNEKVLLALIARRDRLLDGLGPRGQSSEAPPEQRVAGRDRKDVLRSWIAEMQSNVDGQGS